MLLPCWVSQAYAELQVLQFLQAREEVYVTGTQWPIVEGQAVQSCSHMGQDSVEKPVHDCTIAL